MRDIVIYFAAGTMTGVFGAGVGTSFLRNNLYPRIKAVYGASAGTINGAYFLARQEAGASIYWKNLNDGFIKTKINFFAGTWQRFCNRFFKKIPAEKMRYALNIDYLFDIIKRRNKLDIQAIANQEIPLYVKLFNLDTHNLEYIDVRRPDILDILRVSVSVFPYMHSVKNIDGKRLIDAGIIEMVGIDYLINKYPDDKIIIILNRKPTWGLSQKIKNILEGRFMEWMFNDPELYKLHASAEERIEKDIEKIRKNPNTVLVSLPENIQIKSRTTSVKTLIRAYNAGIEEGNKALANLNL